jgi:uncharacterized protein with PQ loop repeat
MNIFQTLVGLGSTVFGALVLIPQLRKIIKLGIHRVPGLSINSIFYSLLANCCGFAYGLTLGSIFVIVPACLNMVMATVILYKFYGLSRSIKSEHEIELLDSSEFTKEWHLDDDAIAALNQSAG